MKNSLAFVLALAVSILLTLTACASVQGIEPQKPNPDVGVHFTV